MTYFLDPCVERRSYKITSLSLYTLFLRIDALVFSDFLHEFKILGELKTDGARFPQKILIGPVLGIKGRKWSKNGMFLVFWKIFLELI